MTLHRTHNHQSAVIALAGALTIGGPVETLKGAVRDLLARGCRRVRLDVSGVPYADASGIGALVECRQRARSAGALLTLKGARGKLRELLELMGLSLQMIPAPALARLPRRAPKHERSLEGAALKFWVA